MAVVDSLEIQISASSEQAATSISKLVSSLNDLKTALKGGVGNKQFQNLCDSLRDLGTAAKDVEDSIGALAKAAKAVERLSSIGKVRIPKSIGDGIRNVGLAAEMVTPQAVENLDRMTRSIQRLSNVDLKGVAGALRGVRSNTANAAREAKTSATVPFNTKGGNPFVALFRRGMLSQPFKLNIDSASLKHAKDLVDGLWSRLKSLGKKIKLRIEAATIGKVKESLGQIQTIMKSLGRIAFYRAIRSVIKAITKAFQEGLNNAYAFSAGLSNAVDGRIATALDGLASSAGTMKNQLGAAFGSLLTAIAPIINTLIGLITALANAITQLFAAFTGGTFLKAKDTTAKFADDMKKGGGAAKEWKNQLMGFDEINRLEDQSGGGGGGGGSGLSAADMFEVQKIDQAIQDFVNNFKSAILAGDWQGVGKLLGGKVNEIFASIDWAGIGEKIGYALNGVIQSIYYTLKEIDFVAIGKDLATLINKAIESIDFEIWGRLLVRKITAAFDLLSGFIGELDFGQLGNAVHNFIVGAFDEATEWLGSYNWSEVGEKAKEKIIAFFDGLSVADLAISISNFLERACNAVKDFFTGLGLKDVVDKMVETLKEFWDNLSPTGKWILGAVIGIGLVSGAFSLAATAAKTFSTVIGALPFLKVIAGLALLVLGVLKVKSALEKWNETGELTKEILGEIIIGVGLVAIAIGLFTSPWLVLSGVVGVVVGAIIKYWDKLVEWWNNTTLGQLVNAGLEDVKQAWENTKKAWEEFPDKVVEFVASVKNDAATWWANVKTWWSEKKQAVEDFAVKVKDDATEWWSNVVTWWGNAKADTLNFSVKVKNSAHQWWNDVKTWWNQVVGDLWTTLQIKLPTIQVEWKPLVSVLGQTIEYPAFSLVWNAKGGIVDGATLIGAGEAGAEAIIPLERNTQWIGKVASDLHDQLMNQRGGYDNSDDNKDVINAIFAVGTQIVNALAESGNSSDIDWRQVATKVTKYQNQMARAGAY